MTFTHSHNVARGLRKIAAFIAVASFAVGFGAGKVF